ncbi:ATP-dependent DNA helicase RecG [Propionimicrobium lymphophilum]|uniref:ATP-dependent DNA helicase RecG n=1 Tax=Propionimicrobium lymphophilum TaxID=33012 RepID=UPI00288C408A|nr:ATP-dependent DNA helicase RecG [Propionimicrobium lymphophilum]
MQSDYRLSTFRRFAEPLSEVLGGKTAKPLASLGLETVGDLLRHFPRRYLSGTQVTDLSKVIPGEEVALVARASNMQKYVDGQRSYFQDEIASQTGTRARSSARKGRMSGTLLGGSGEMSVTFFGREYMLDYWHKELVGGKTGIFVGKVGIWQNRPQMTNPQFIMLDSAGKPIGKGKQDKIRLVNRVQRSSFVGIYPATKSASTWLIADAVEALLELLVGLEDPLPAGLRKELGLMEINEAINQIHRPENLDENDAARYRLKFDEALSLQVAMADRRAATRANEAAPIQLKDDGLLAKFDSQLPFELTEGQQKVGEEIFADMAKPAPMQRLLQGEVGSGKTVVALRAMLAALDAGKQAVLMAPTEVLATQHAESMSKLLASLGLDVELLTGSMAGSQAKTVRSRIASGQARIVVGTHALISAATEFQDLGLVVIDEQHRFGVAQREALQRKVGLWPHTLVLTATPIPRSIAMTIFGDLEVSTLRQLPAGRQEIQTTVVNRAQNPGWVPRVWQRVREEIEKGRQAFVVCPRISSTDDELPTDSEASPSAAVEDVFDELSAGPLAGLRLAKLHGRMPAEKKATVMADFAVGNLDVLISTTVIEVGVDVPNASAMIIIDADRFGVAQLHQLRGRIGRGGYAGLCLLLTNSAPDSPSLERLNWVSATRDGFQLAEYDLEVRREGNIMGPEQSGGRSALRLLRVVTDSDLIERSREVAEKIEGQEVFADLRHDMALSIENQDA